jgi:hypothetical protein
MNRGRRPHTRIDWERVSATLGRERPKRYHSFSRRSGAKFQLSQRRQWLSYIYSEPLGRLDEDSVLPYVAQRVLIVIKELGPEVVLYGIHKKGASLLEDLAARYPFIGEHTLVSDSEETEHLVRGRTVLIIDDSIHRGKSCQVHLQRLRAEGASRVAIFVVIASRRGLVRAGKLKTPITCLMDVPERLFTLSFALLMVPTLGLFRNGALSNRPHRGFSIGFGTSRPQAAALRALRLISGLGCFGTMSEVPAVDGQRAAVYHASATPSAKTLRATRVGLSSHASLDQVKFRVLLSKVDDSFHLCVCAIVWPIGRRGVTSSAVEVATEQVATRLLDSVETDLSRAFAGSGLHISRAQPLFKTS